MSTVDRGCDRIHDSRSSGLTEAPEAGLVSLPEAARRLSLKPSSVQSALQDGVLRRGRVDGASCVDVSSIEEYLVRPSVVIRRERDARTKTVEPIRPRRLAVGPLLRLMSLRHGLGFTIADAARELDVNQGVIYRALREGLTIYAADRWAHAMGEHPALIWGDNWFRTADIAASMRRHPSAGGQLLENDGPLPAA